MTTKCCVLTVLVASAASCGGPVGAPAEAFEAPPASAKAVPAPELVTPSPVTEVRTGEPVTPRPTSEADLPFLLFENRDSDTPIKASKARELVIQGDLDEAELRKALTDYYRLLRAELAQSTNPTRHVWLFAYPNEARAKAGRGEWYGRASAMAFDGKPLPEEPELTIKMPQAGDATPTERENQIYDELMQALEQVDSAGEYQDKVMATRGSLTMADIQRMGRLTEQDEAKVNRAIAKKYKLTEKQLDDLVLKVLVSRQ